MKTVRKNNRNLKRKFSKRRKATKRRINKKTNNKKYQKRIKRKTRRRTKRKLKRSVKRYDIQKGGALQDYGEGHANTCLNGAIEMAIRSMLGIDPAGDEYPYLPEDGMRVKLSFIRHCESTSNTQFGRDRGRKAMELAIDAGVSEEKARALNWGGEGRAEDRGDIAPGKKNENEMYWGYTHAFLTEYGRIQAYSTGYYKLWEMFCNGDYDMDFFCSVLPRACQSAKLATAGFIQRLRDVRDARGDRGTLDDFIGGCSSEFINKCTDEDWLDSVISYYGKKSIKIVNGISELPATVWEGGPYVPDISDTQRCMREDLLPDMVKFLNGTEHGCDLKLDGLDTVFTGVEPQPPEAEMEPEPKPGSEPEAEPQPGLHLERPRNYAANEQYFSQFASKQRGFSGYMTTEESVFSFLFNLQHWLRRTPSEERILEGKPEFFGAQEDIRKICFVHGLMMGEYMPWPLFTDSIKQILPDGGQQPDARGEMEPESEMELVGQGGDSGQAAEPESEMELVGQGGDSGQAAEPMEGYVTGVEEAKKHFPDIFFAGEGPWPYAETQKDAKYQVEIEDINWRNAYVYEGKTMKMYSNGVISLGDTVIRYFGDPCQISLPKSDRKGRPHFIVIEIRGMKKKINFVDSRGESDYQRFLRDAMCMGCGVSRKVLEKIEVQKSSAAAAQREREAQERAQSEEETLRRRGPEMKTNIFEGLLAQLQAIPQEGTPEIYESLLSQILFYGKYKYNKLTAETVKNAIEAVVLSPDLMGKFLQTDENEFNVFDRELRSCYDKCMESLTLYEGDREQKGWEGILRSIGDNRDSACFESSFMKQPPNATCVSFEFERFPTGNTGLQDAYLIYKSATHKKPINFWSLFLHKNVSGVEFKSPPLRLKKPEEMGSRTQIAYNLLVAQIKQADVNNYYHTNSMIKMIFGEVSRYESFMAESPGQQTQYGMSNLKNRCINIIEKALEHVKADESSWYFPAKGGLGAQLEEIFKGGWESGWGFDISPVFATLLDDPPEGNYFSITTWAHSTLYAKIEDNSLQIYNVKPYPKGAGKGAQFSAPPNPLRGSSLKKLNGCEVIQAYDSGHPKASFQIKISGVTSDNSDSPPTNGVFKINFDDLELANDFYIALRNLSKGREYNSSSIYEAIAAETAA